MANVRAQEHRTVANTANPNADLTISARTCQTIEINREKEPASKPIHYI